MPGRGHSINSIITPEIDDVSGQSRRSSFAGGVMSPEVEGGPKPPLEQDQFYLTKKDSQRRKTLSEVLTEDQAEICEYWLSHIEGSMLTKPHLELLNTALRDYIVGDEKEVLEVALNELKAEFIGDNRIFSHLQLALLHYEEAANHVLRSKKIKPHWMFALDHLLRTSVEAARSLLPPEVSQDKIFDPAGTSSVNSNSTVNSQRTSISFQTSSKLRHRAQFNAMKSENNRLIQEMLEVQKNLQSFLRQMLDNQRASLAAMKGIADNSELVAQALTNLVHNTNNNNNHCDPNGNLSLVPHIDVTNGDHDQRLTEWLLSLQVDQPSINKFLAEEYSFEDVLQFMSREDLRRLNLRGGVELKIWRAILAWRRDHRPQNYKKPPTGAKNVMCNNIGNNHL